VTRNPAHWDDAEVSDTLADEPEVAALKTRIAELTDQAYAQQRMRQDAEQRIAALERVVEAAEDPALFDVIDDKAAYRAQKNLAARIAALKEQA
jgi:hypothetical protein